MTWKLVLPLLIVFAGAVAVLVALHRAYRPGATDNGDRLLPETDTDTPVKGHRS